MVMDIKGELYAHTARYFDDARIIQLGLNGTNPIKTTVLVVCAGTADVPVAEEAAVTAWHRAASSMLTLLPGRILRFFTRHSR